MPSPAPESLHIRHYTESDLEACRDLWCQLTDWHRHLYQSPTIGGDNPGIHFDAHLKRVGAELIWVAEVPNQIIGFTGMIPGEEEEAELEPIIISDAYRGQGIGARLVEHVLREARQRGYQRVIVRPVARNTQAIQFFYEAGFDTLGQLELMLDLRPKPDQPWVSGEHLAHRDFRF